MKTQKTKSQAPKIRVGSVITFTNNTGYKVRITVKRVEEKSWYARGRNSYGTLIEFLKYPDFKIEY